MCDIANGVFDLAIGERTAAPIGEARPLVDLDREPVIDKIGIFDEKGFPRGFGEEDDFCLRATNAGFGIALAHDTYVFHAKSKSYGSSRRESLTAAGQQELRRKHGEARLKRAVETMKMNPYLEEMREHVARQLGAK